MAGPYNPVVKNAAYVFAVALQDLANPGSYEAAPTLAAGDVKVDIDGAGFSNLATLPTVTPAAGRRVQVSLSAGEMNGDNITIQFVDQTVPKEWADLIVVVQTSTANFGAVGDAAASVLSGLQGATFAVASVAGDVSGTVNALSGSERGLIADAILARNAAGGSNGGKTVAYYVQGGLPKIDQAADGLTVTIYSADGATPLANDTLTRLANTVGGVRNITQG